MPGALTLALALSTPAAPQGPPPTAERRIEEVHYDWLDELGRLLGGTVELDLPLGDAGPRLAPATTLGAAFGPPANPANRVDVVYVGDGYTAGELGAYASHVDAIQPTFFLKEPFREYQSYFTVHRVDVVSNESGVDNDPVQGVQRDTALDMGYWCSGVQRLLCVDVGVARSFANNAPDADLICAIANSSTYGGAGYPSSDLATSAGFNSSSIEIVLHEFGHALGDLADEYDYGGPVNWPGGEPNDPNSSTYPAAAMGAQQRKWWRWLGSTVTGFDGLISTYEGSSYSQQGIYRPTNNSLMRNLGRPFNMPSVEAVLFEIHRIVDPIDSSSDPGVPHAPSEILSVTPLQPRTHALAIQWSLDGAPIPGATGTTLDLSTLALSACNSFVSVTVSDPTPWVRDEARRAELLTSTRVFQLDVGLPVANECLATPNSTGSPAQIYNDGSTSIARNDLVLWAGPVPPGAIGIYFLGQGAQQTPFGNGYLCVAAPVFRLGVASADPLGFAARALDLAALPGGAPFPHELRRFQYWYRNPAGGGAGFNLSDALRVTFCP
jgi:hypothetical protein